MDWLNYHHLLYFYTVAREGTIARASELLLLSPSTISVQIKTLEEALDTPLFERVGRNLVMTPEGQVAYSYAEEIFGLGQELLDTFRERPVGRPQRLTVGIADVVWKDIAYQLVQPATRLDHAVRLRCVEGTFDELLAALAVHHVDVVIADAPIGPAVNVKAYNHQLGECGVALFGRSDLVERYGEGFPESLDGAPILLPTEKTALRRSMMQWFQTQGVRPRVVAEFDDSALMMSFGANGDGLFPAPVVVAEDIELRYPVERLATLQGVEQRFFAISVERRIKHPAVQAICAEARDTLFGDEAEEMERIR